MTSLHLAPNALCEREDHSASPPIYIRDNPRYLRPLVVLRMDRGELPFRYIGKHRHVSLKDVLALKTKPDVRQKTMEDLAANSEDLHLHYGI